LSQEAEVGVISLPIALLDPQRHVLAVDVGHLQRRDFGHAQATLQATLSAAFS
jgi:hypothetical protein